MNYEGIYTVIGPPGTGKTAYATKQVKKICETVEWPSDEASPVVVCSLTKAAAREVASRDMPIPDWQVGTLHSMAYRQIGSPPVAESEASAFNESNPDLAIAADPDVDDSTGEVNTSNPDFTGNAQYQLYQLYRACMTPRSEWRPDIQFFADRWEDWKRRDGLVDFSDMIELAATQGRGHAPGKPSVIIVDEAQDMSRLEWQLLRVYYEAADALIAIGDPYQSIFSWRGADSSIFFDPAIPDDHKKILGMSYRVPRLVRDLSLKWVRENLSNFVDITYKTRDEDGALGYFGNVSYNSPDALIDYVENILRTTDDTVMVLGSCGYMLRPLIALLRQRGVPFSNRWRRKRGDWNPLGHGKGQSTHIRLMMMYKMLRGERPATFADANGMLKLVQSGGTLRHGAKTFLSDMAVTSGNARMEMYDLQNVFEPDAWSALQATVRSEYPERAFGDWVKGHASEQKQNALQYAAEVMSSYGVDSFMHEPRLTIGSIHSVKGGEADHVIMFPDLSPSGMSEFSSPVATDRDGVIRMFYVAMTRARKSFTVCDRKSWNAVEIPLDTL